MRRLDDGTPRGKPITIDFEGEAIPAWEGEPVAVALLAAGETVFSRSVKYHRPRGPFCFAAACSHCLMRVDGVPNVYTCKTPARAGMRVERQNAYPSAKFDLLGATDWLFPHGLDHHELFAGVPVAQKVMVKVARHLTGLGLLPERPAPTRLESEVLRAQVAIIGAGPAGLAAAQALAARKVSFVLAEREPQLGGRLVHGPLEGNEPEPPPPSAFPPGSVRLATAAIGAYEDDGGGFVALVDYSGPKLLRLYSQRLLIAVGGHPQLIPFENNDLPGVLAARAASALLRKHRVLPGEAVVLVGEGAELYALSRLLADHGSKPVAVVDLSDRPRKGALAAQPLRAHGRKRVRSLDVRLANGRTRRIACDTIVLCRPPSPGFELARQAGAHVDFDDRQRLFVVRADDEGRTARPAVFAAGEVTGAMSALAAIERGRRAGEAIARSLEAAG